MMIRTSKEIYLDANATTPVLPEAAREAHDAMEELFGNPSSSHISGLRARFMLESTRDLVREVIGASQGQVVFTSGATEAIQMGIFSTLCHVRQQRTPGEAVDPPRLILYGATEHKAIPQAIHHWNQLLGVNNKVLQIPVDQDGRLDLEFLRQHAPQADLVCTMAVNNETGVITDLEQIEQAIRGQHPYVHWVVDCVQAIGKIELKLDSTSIDYAAISGHKIYAPKGIGVLYARDKAPLVPLLAGGGQERGARGGTENLPGVAAIAAVMKKLAGADKPIFRSQDRLYDFRDRILHSLKIAFPTIVFNTPFETSVPTTINFAVKGFPSKELLDLFDAAGIRVSSGSACGSAIQGSYVLEAMGLPKWRTDGAIRLSFGPLATEADIDGACHRIEQAGKALCDSCLVVSSDVDAESSQQLDGLIQLKYGSMCTWMLMDSTTRSCVIIDPFEELADRVESLVRCQNSQIEAILDTHAHVDHESCRVMLLKVLQQYALPSAHTSDLLGWPETVDGEVTLDDGTVCPYFQFNDRWIIAQADMPGHTTIGKSLLVGSCSEPGRMKREDVVFAFTGDTILMGGIGRTDFPCSTIEGMYDSLRRLPQQIGMRTILCPTHDYNNDFATTLHAECRDNEFLSQILDNATPLSQGEFLARKPAIDEGIRDGENKELVCGLIRPVVSSEDDVSIDLTRDQLKSFFQTHQSSWIIDVREPHEFAFEQDWEALGFETPPENIPLTRLAGHLPRLISPENISRDIIFLCRSGRRSGKAAQIARRIGIANARHIAGGLALNIDPHGDPKSLEPGYMI